MHKEQYTQIRQVTLGLKPYKSKHPGHVYILCKNETDLIVKFMEVWNRFDIDILTGWNIENFDIPYFNILRNA